MVEIFPEIETFFQQRQFTQQELDTLKELMESQYRDDHSRKLANSAINIKLLQYQLSGPVVARTKERGKRDIRKLLDETRATSSSVNSTSGKKKLKSRGDKETAELKKIPHNAKLIKGFLLEQATNYPLTHLAKYLKMKPNDLVKRLNFPSKLKITENSIFTEDLLERNIRWMQARIISIRVTGGGFKNKRIKKSDNSIKSTPGVYGNLLKTKTIGSLIYTRMSN